MDRRAKFSVAILMIVGVVLLLVVPKVFARTLSLEARSGEPGETIPLTVWIDKTPEAIEAFGFEILYDRRVLQYTGAFSPDVLSRRFDYLDVNEPQPGRLKIGAFTTQNPIEAGRSGRLLTLEFTVVEPDDTRLRLVNPVDDVAEWATQPGRFDGINRPVETSTSNASTSSITSSGSDLSPAGSEVVPIQMSTVTLPAEPSTQPSPQPSRPALPRRIDAAPRSPLVTKTVSQLPVNPVPRQSVGGRAHQASAPSVKTFPTAPVTSTTEQKVKPDAPNVMAAPLSRSDDTGTSDQPTRLKPDDQVRLNPGFVQENGIMVDGFSLFLFGSVLIGAIVTAVLQRKQLHLQQKQLLTLTHTLEQIIRTYNRTEENIRMQTEQTLQAAKLNALNTLIGLTRQGVQVHESSMEMDGDAEPAPVPEHLKALDTYANKMATMVQG